MEKGFLYSKIKAALLRLAQRIGRINEGLFAAGVVALIALLLIPTFRDQRHELHAVVGPAGGSAVAAAPPAVPKPDPNKLTEQVTVATGDTLLGILSHVGVESSDADGLVAALSPIFGPRDLHPGQTINFSLMRDPIAGTRRLEGVQINLDSTRDIVAAVVAPGQYDAKIIPQKVTYRPVLVSGTITSTLYGAAESAGLPLSILMEMIRAYSFDVDFQRDVHPGDSFQVVYQKTYDSRGRYLSDGDMLFASLTLRGKTSQIYEYKTERGFVDYFNSAGQSVRKMLMRTPVQGAWISSVFGWRKNPIYGYSEFHRGLDFAVPTNTPIMAAGNGTVVVAGWSNDYGNYVRLQHPNGYQTLYGHMIAFARGIHAGAVVSQGQVIGYVGTTGMSTGPHLHYEVIYRGERINPATVVSPSGPVLTGAELAGFERTKQKIDREYEALKAGKPVPASQGNVAEQAHPSGSSSG